VEYENEFFQQIDPIYLDPHPEGFLNFRSHFYAPRKYFAGRYWNTYNFNLVFIWFLTLILYITLYYKVLKRIMDLPELIKKKK